MKAILEFSLPEESEEYKNAMEGSSMCSALHDTTQEVFRPARKHGYPDGPIREFFAKHSENEQSKFAELIGLLEDRFIEVLKDHSLL